MKGELLQLIKKQGFSLDEIAYILGITKESLMHKLDSFEFLSREIKLLVLVLKIKNPITIFFA